jgi:hypothetical protein
MRSPTSSSSGTVSAHKVVHFQVDATHLDATETSELAQDHNSAIGSVERSTTADRINQRRVSLVV